MNMPRQVGILDQPRLASVMVLGTGKFKITLDIDLEGDIHDEVICNPPN